MVPKKETNLPPAGDAQRDELKRRDDALAEQAETVAAETETYAMPKVEREREVMQALDPVTSEVYVTKADTERYHYTWVYRDPTGEGGGRWVRKAITLGYQIVKGDMPEAREHQAVTTERWVGDCLLMRIPVEHYQNLLKANRAYRERVSQGVAAQLEDKVGRLPRDYRGRVVGLDEMPQGGGMPGPSQATQQEAARRQRGITAAGVGIPSPDRGQ